MQQIPLTQGHFALVDDDDYPLISQHKWTYDNTGYAVRKITIARGRYKKVLMHRILTNAQPGQIVDHADGNGLNNTRSNLRLCNGSQNNANRWAKRKTETPYKGVKRAKTPGRWEASIGHNYKVIYLGTFDTPEQAAAAYATKAQELFGGYTNTSVLHVGLEPTTR